MSKTRDLLGTETMVAATEVKATTTTTTAAMATAAAGATDNNQLKWQGKK